MAVTLKVITLNCWALPFPVLCKNRLERIKAIGDFLRDGDFDIVVLEEIWVKSDFHQLREKLKKKLPFSHYFYSGTVGSGMCVFSRHLIAETSFHRFQLNGHAHKIFHGDWFGGKGVGLCKIHEEGLDINVYCSHFHAEYNPGNDEYEAHRLAQTFELCQFIRATSADCDMVILAGDLNTTPTQLGYKLVTGHAHLKDAWVEQGNKDDAGHGGTCDVPSNSYSSSHTLERSPYGDRIDYVMYSVKNNCSAKVVECKVGLGKIPHLNISYSDHEAVMAIFSVTKTKELVQRPHRPVLTREVRESLQESLLVLDKGVSQCLSEEKFFQLVVFLLSVILYLLNNSMYFGVNTHSENFLIAFTMAATKLFMAIAIGFSLWTALIVKRAEFHGLIACKEDIMKLTGI